MSLRLATSLLRDVVKIPSNTRLGGELGSGRDDKCGSLDEVADADAGADARNGGVETVAKFSAFSAGRVCWNEKRVAVPFPFPLDVPSTNASVA